MKPKFVLVESLTPFEDWEVAYRLGLRWWRQVTLWRSGKAFPQRRLWPLLASFLRCTVKDIEAAYATYRDGRER